MVGQQTSQRAILCKRQIVPIRPLAATAFERRGIGQHQPEKTVRKCLGDGEAMDSMLMRRRRK
ncbi:hypothetical protein D3C72_2535240 [compost metagenome]